MLVLLVEIVLFTIIVGYLCSSCSKSRGLSSNSEKNANNTSSVEAQVIYFSYVK